MSELLLQPGLVVAAYLLGSVSSAIIVCKLMGLGDPREAGSGNPGATNVLRIGGERGKLAAGITLAGDMLKGLVPVLLAHALGFDPLWIVLVGLAAFLGHLYPLFFQFKGGKGVATMLGILLALNFWAGLATVATWLFVAKVLKISSLSALIATLLAPIYLYFIVGELSWVLVTALMTTVLFWRHRSNIGRLLRGEESLIKAKKPE
ncbi:glycerol-3-phosphate 1-O-acyltransferase PlsY [Thiomicrospira microaerophila]|uniref:glycerol-3-phosphate 1-O-acyltransferase PlsY n=1 Tax=Thiomicrospira microaerophila TaxID=406020 RepID=UPI00200D140D|nr:glycerol-3-phosphate 1-O-acyltransferase PlsY [Thiomicrospira microaerophila]UQB41649.1 glycerol-3-phosphate 1-O-acyltransferase PlsY [Thiomicrospira microaerophila]